MREHHGPRGRVSTKLKAALVALLAVFAISGLSATQASAAQQLKLTFNDSWIGVPSLSALTGGGIHAIDPADEDGVAIDLTGSLANDGAFRASKSAFSFPDQNFEIAPGMAATLAITANDDIVGTYDQTSGAFSADLSLNLNVNGLGGAVDCTISPLNIPLKTDGSYDFGSETVPNVLSGAPFTTGSGAVLGSWSGVTLESVTGPTPEMTEGCHALIGGLIGEDDDPETPAASFDGTIWLGGTAAVTGEPDKPGPDPEIKPRPGKVGKITAQPKKAKVKKGKKRVIKVKVKNSGQKVLKTKLKIKAPKAKVNVKKQIQIKVPAGKVKTFKVPVKVKKTKKAKGKAKIVFTAGGKKAVATLTIKK